MKKNIFILFILIITSLYTEAKAQSSEHLFASVSDDTILIGNYFELSFTIKNVEGKFEAPELEDFEIMGGPNVSSSFQFMNGESSQEKTYSYYLKPTKEGTLYIPPAYLVLDEKGFETLPIEINVLPNPDGIITQPTKKQQPSLFDNWTPFGSREMTPKKDSKKPSKWKKRKI